MHSPESTTTLVNKIWNLCHILRGDGVSYHQYISELTYLLFLKIAATNKTERLIPKNYRWSDLYNYKGPDLLTHYRDILTFLGGHATDDRVRKIYSFPTTVFSHGENLRAVLDGIEKLDLRTISRDTMGNIYEGLLARNSQDARSGAGQYFTPRALTESIVRVMQPKDSEIIQDPAAGSGGFLVAAHQYISKTRSGKASTKSSNIFEGMEIEKSTFRICLMNSFLHEMEVSLFLGDALTSDANSLRKANLILANPPFGNRTGSARKQRSDLVISTGSKQLAFLQHIYNGLTQGGRAAVVLPDSVLFEEGAAKRVRQDLMAKCNLHTILRLPPGLFYAQGVMTNVLFFSAEKSKIGTSSVWIYDMRSGTRPFGKKNPLTPRHFEDFEACFGNDPLGRAKRTESQRFRSFTRKEISERDDNLDITWLRANVPANNDYASEPSEILGMLSALMRSVVEQIEDIGDQLAADEAEE